MEETSKKNTNESSQKKFRSVYIVDGARTPYLKMRGKRGPFSAADLAVAAGQALLARQTFKPTALDEVIMGCIMPSENEANIAKIVSLRLGCGKKVPAWTVQRNCGSGMQAVDAGFKDIALGRHDLVLVGGTESMSHAPLLLRPEMIDWLAEWNTSKSFLKQLKTFFKLRPAYFSPIIALLRGLRDPVVGLNMGETAEELAYQFGITRAEMDAYALRSHERAARAQDQGFMGEVVNLYDKDGHFYNHDDGVRRDSSLEKLGQLKPFYDKPFGVVTAGNSCQVTDGAAMLILASEEAVRKYQLPTLGKIVDVEWASLDPKTMGLGPIYAATPILKRQQMTLADVDYWEINEAFAAQVLGCLKAWESEDFCKNELGLQHALGTLDQERLNVDGGAIAVGHPVGSSGARIVLHLLQVLKRQHAKYGMASICIGGGQGGAMLVEATPSEL